MAEYKKRKLSPKYMQKLRKDNWIASRKTIKTYLKMCSENLNVKDFGFPMFGHVPKMGKFGFDSDSCHILNKGFPLDFYVLMVEDYLLTELIDQ
jgi:hypothetical protein